MDPRLIALMKMAQRAKQPVRRFADGDYVDEIPLDPSFANLTNEDLANLENIGGNLLSDVDISKLTDFPTGDTPNISAEDFSNYNYGNIDEILSQIDPASLKGFDEGLSGAVSGYGDGVSVDDMLTKLGGLDTDASWREYMQNASLTPESKEFRTALDSQAANKYLEETGQLTREQINEAYASAQPRFVTFGGKTYETGVDRFGNYTGTTPGREVKYDSKGNLVDPITNKIVSQGPGTTTTNTIKEIIEKYTGGGGGGGGGGGQQKKSDLSSLLPLLLMMMMMNRQQPQTTGQAVIPKLSADRAALPYQQIQQAPGYRPGQGGVQYVSDVAYKPMATGGIADLSMMAGGGTPVGGKLLKGPGDGVSDSIPATIGGTQPARLARGEFVVDARTVSELGNGSTEAGAEKLYKMMDRVHSARKKAGRGKDSGAAKYLPA